MLLKNAHRQVNAAAIEAQKAIDEANGLGLNAIEAPYPQRRVNDLLYKAGAPGTPYTSAMKLLDQPVVTLTQAFHDDHIKANADARWRAGMDPQIVRRAVPKCCAWCSSLEGTYDYEDVSDTGNDVFRRHENCRCTVEYVCDGTRQDVWSKKFYTADAETLQKRSEYHTSTGDTSPETLRMRSKYGVEKDVDNDAPRDIIKTYPEWDHIVPFPSEIPDAVRKNVNEAEKMLLQDFPLLKGKYEPIRYGYVTNGLAEYSFTPSTGHAVITLLDSVFSDPEQLMNLLRDDYEKYRSYEVTSYLSLVAHEMGHCAHNTLALKRCGFSYGSPLSSDEWARLRTEKSVILEEIYDICFPGWKENLKDLRNKSIVDFGIKTIDPPDELIAQAFGKHYYGKKRSKIAKSIVQYFSEGLS